MLANDPHLETNRLPNVWVEQSFRWPEGYAILMTMPGLPGSARRAQRAPVLGRYVHLHGRDRLVGRTLPGREVPPRRSMGRLRSTRGDDQAQEGRADRRDVLGEPARGARWSCRAEGYALATRWSGSDGRRPVGRCAAPHVDGANGRRRDGGVRHRRVFVQLGLCRQRGRHWLPDVRPDAEARRRLVGLRASTRLGRTIRLAGLRRPRAATVAVNIPTTV